MHSAWNVLPYMASHVATVTIRDDWKAQAASSHHIRCSNQKCTQGLEDFVFKTKACGCKCINLPMWYAWRMCSYKLHNVLMHDCHTSLQDTIVCLLLFIGTDKQYWAQPTYRYSDACIPLMFSGMHAQHPASWSTNLYDCSLHSRKNTPKSSPNSTTTTHAPSAPI